MMFVLELYGAFSALSLLAFLTLASVAKLRPDLDEHVVELFGPARNRKRLIQRRPRRIDTRKPSLPNRSLNGRRSLPPAT
jgi:hypothetical protein